VGFYSVLLWLRSAARDLQMAGTWGQALLERVNITWDALADGEEKPDAEGRGYDAVIDVLSDEGDRPVLRSHRAANSWRRWCSLLEVTAPELLCVPADNSSGPPRDSGEPEGNVSWLTLTLPGFGQRSPHRSIEWMELGTKLVEQLVCLQFGLMAANRGTSTREIHVPSSAGLAGRFELIDRDGKLAKSAEVGSKPLRQALEPGFALLVDCRR
jgi:hypothetical protein